jgi:hypothetical protein
MNVEFSPDECAAIIALISVWRDTRTSDKVEMVDDLLDSVEVKIRIADDESERVQPDADEG